MTQSSSSASEAGLTPCTGAMTILGGKPSRSPAEEARPSAGSRQSSRSKPTAKHGAGRLQEAGPSTRTQDNRPRPTSRRVAELVGRSKDHGSDCERLVAEKKPRVARRVPSEEGMQVAERGSLEPSPPSYDPPAHLRQQQDTANRVGSKGIARAKLRQAILRFFEAGGHREEALRDAEEAWAARGAGVRSLP